MRNHWMKMLAPLLVAAAALTLAACGGGGDESDTVAGSFEALPEAPPAYANVAGEAELTRAGGETTATISLEGLEPDTEYMAHLHTAGCGGSEPGGPHFRFDPAGGEEPPNEIHFAFTSDAEGGGEAEASAEREVPAGEAGSIVLHLGDHGATASTSLFVHEGVDHSKEGPGHGEGDDHGAAGHGADDGANEEMPAAEKIACAELEGGTAQAAEGETGGEGGEATPIPTVVVEDGEPVGGVAELEFDAGEEIRFKVESDAAEEIHVHGYDLAEDVPAGGSVTFEFPAEIEGIFEAELERLGVQIIELRVNP